MGSEDLPLRISDMYLDDTDAARLGTTLWSSVVWRPLKVQDRARVRAGVRLEVGLGIPCTQELGGAREVGIMGVEGHRQVLRTDM